MKEFNVTGVCLPEEHYMAFDHSKTKQRTQKNEVHNGKKLFIVWA